MANQSPIPLIPLLKVPANYPTVPSPGKIRILYDKNKKELYHRLSPYGTDTFMGIKSTQPFNYVYPDGPKSSDCYLIDYVQHALNDVKRITKFMISGQGVLWIGKQFLLQTGNAFNETRIWNPTSPIVAASAIIRPQRNIDTSNLLGSLLGGVGSAVGGVLGLGNSPTAPSGTVGMSALSRNSVTAQSGGKGLLRADTANAGLATFRSKWGPPATGGGFLSDFIKKTFNNFIPARQEGIKVRSDEKSYGWMIGDGTWAGAFDYGGTSQRVEFHQRWIAGDKGGIRIADQDNMMRGGIVYTTFNGLRYLQNTKTYSKTLQNGIKFGWSIEPSTDPIHPGIRYENAIGMKATDQDGEYFASSMMVQWGMFQETGKESQYPSKMTDPKGASVLAEILYNKIQVLKENPIYTFPNVNSTDNGVFPTKPYASIRGYERLMLVKNIGDPKHFGNDKTKLFTLAAYRAAKVRVLENQHTDATEKSFKMGGSQQFDGINTLTVLDSSRVIKNTYTNYWKQNGTAGVAAQSITNQVTLTDHEMANVVDFPTESTTRFVNCVWCIPTGNTHIDISTKKPIQSKSPDVFTIFFGDFNEDNMTVETVEYFILMNRILDQAKVTPSCPVHASYCGPDPVEKLEISSVYSNCRDFVVELFDDVPLNTIFFQTADLSKVVETNRWDS
jgi:hypothetical protein